MKDGQNGPDGLNGLAQPPERPEALPAQIDPTKLRYLARRKQDERYFAVAGIHFPRAEVFLMDPAWTPADGGEAGDVLAAV